MEDFSPAELKTVMLEELLLEEHPDDQAYVYWMPDGMNKVTPYIFKCYTFSDLMDHLQQLFGAQAYWIIIRRKKEMKFSGAMLIGEPINHIPKKDIRAEYLRLRDAYLARNTKKRKRMRRK